MWDFGPLEASRDDSLLANGYYHETVQIRELQTHVPAAHCIFVTRPGSGKTALSRWLQEKPNKTTLFISPKKNRVLFSDDDLNTADYLELFRTELAVQLVADARQHVQKKKKGDLRSRCDDLVDRSWFDIARSALKNVQSLEAFGFGIGLDTAHRATYLKRLRTEKTGDLSQSLLAEINAVLPLTVVIDDPELIVVRGMDELARENALRVGCFLNAVSSIHAVGLETLVFVKEHVLQAVNEHYSDYNQIRTLVTSLDWTENDLMSLIKLRVSKRLKQKWADVFRIRESDFAKNVFPLLVNGPRDLLGLCTEASRHARTGAIALEHIEKASMALRDTKYQELRSQYRAWPRIDAFCRGVLDALDGRAKAPMAVDTFRSLVRTAHQSVGTTLNDLRGEPWIKQIFWSQPTLVELLHLVGFIGYVSQGVFSYTWQGRNLEGLADADSVFVTGLFVE